MQPVKRYSIATHESPPSKLLFAPTPREIQPREASSWGTQHRKDSENEVGMKEMNKIYSAQFGSPEEGISPIKSEEDTLPNNLVNAGEGPFRTLQQPINIDHLPYDKMKKKLRPFIQASYDNVEDYVKIKSTIDTNYTAVREPSPYEKDFVCSNVSPLKP